MACTYSLIYANNLYDYVTSKFLPTNGFKWIDPKKCLIRINILALAPKDVLSKMS